MKRKFKLICLQAKWNFPGTPILPPPTQHHTHTLTVILRKRKLRFNRTSDEVNNNNQTENSNNSWLWGQINLA